MISTLSERSLYNTEEQIKLYHSRKLKDFNNIASILDKASKRVSNQRTKGAIILGANKLRNLDILNRIKNK